MHERNKQTHGRNSKLVTRNMQTGPRMIFVAKGWLALYTGQVFLLSKCVFRENGKEAKYIRRGRAKE